MKPGNNKANDFAIYKAKWGLSNYRFKIIHNDRVIVSHISLQEGSWGSGEIRTVHNLMKRRNNKFSLKESTGNDYMEFEGLNELLEYMLVKKIAF